VAVRAKADSSGALRNHKQKKQRQRQRQEQPQVLRLAALAQDDNFYLVLSGSIWVDCGFKKVEAATGAASASMLG
jgi:hypothetical protein